MRQESPIPTELALGPEDGLPADCVASFDNIQPFSKSLLVRRVGVLASGQEHEICEAIDAAIDC